MVGQTVPRMDRCLRLFRKHFRNPDDRLFRDAGLLFCQLHRICAYHFFIRIESMNVFFNELIIRIMILNDVVRHGICQIAVGSDLRPKDHICQFFRGMCITGIDHDQCPAVFFHHGKTLAHRKIVRKAIHTPCNHQLCALRMWPHEVSKNRRITHHFRAVAGG